MPPPDDDDVVRLPTSNMYMGSCPSCGATIWESDQIHEKQGDKYKVYACLRCKYITREDDIIPF